MARRGDVEQRPPVVEHEENHILLNGANTSLEDLALLDSLDFDDVRDVEIDFDRALLATAGGVLEFFTDDSSFAIYTYPQELHNYDSYAVLSVNDDILAVARGRLQAEADAVAALIDTVDDSLVTAASLILAGTGKLFIGGSGTSGTVARRMAHILSVTGTPSLPFSPMDGLHGASGAIAAKGAPVMVRNIEDEVPA